MNLKEFFKASGDSGDYYSRNKPIIIFASLLGIVGALLGSSQAFPYLLEVFDFAGGAAAAFAVITCLIIEGGKAFSLSSFSRDIVRHNYPDLILAVFSFGFIFLSLFTSTTGVKQIAGEKGAAKKDIAIDSIMKADTAGVNIASLLPPDLEPNKGSANWVKVSLQQSQAKAVEAARGSIEALERLERLKSKRQEFELNRAKELEEREEEKGASVLFLLIAYELVIVLCSLCVGYIQGKKKG